MYKVFDLSYHIIFSHKVLNKSSKLISSHFEIDSLNSESNSSYLVVNKNPFKALLEWYKDYEFIDAAGGLVNMRDSYLWIFRNNKWDLPKGKVEINESFSQTALREVKEECGLNNTLEIVKLLYTSFHVYEQFGKQILKRTHWYLMNYSGNDILKPQIEEGISSAIWANSTNSQKYAKLSFDNIKEVWDALKI